MANRIALACAAAALALGLTGALAGCSSQPAESTATTTNPAAPAASTNASTDAAPAGNGLKAGGAPRPMAAPSVGVTPGSSFQVGTKVPGK